MFLFYSTVLEIFIIVWQLVFGFITNLLWAYQNQMNLQDGELQAHALPSSGLLSQSYIMSKMTRSGERRLSGSSDETVLLLHEEEEMTDPSNHTEMKMEC
jgi:hypothetical protein